MELLKKYVVVIAVVILVLILVVIRLVSTNHFKNDTKKWAEPSVVQSNIISAEKFGSLSGDKLIVDLGEEKCGIAVLNGNEIRIIPGEILQNENLKKIRKNNGPVLLFSTDLALSSRIWMVLSQLGYKNIFILTKEDDNEVFKYKFRTDSINIPEL